MKSTVRRDMTGHAMPQSVMTCDQDSLNNIFGNDLLCHHQTQPMTNDYKKDSIYLKDALKTNQMHVPGKYTQTLLADYFLIKITL